MTLVHLSCPLCSGILEVDASAAGLQISCPGCLGMITVPPVPSELEAAPPNLSSLLPPTDVVAELACPHCAGTFQVTREMEDAQVACPHCQGVVTVPLISAAVAPVISAAVADEGRRIPTPPKRHPDSVREGSADALRTGNDYVPLESYLLPSPVEALPSNVDPPNRAVSGRVQAISSNARGTQLAPTAPVLIPTEDGGYVAVREPVKTIGKPGQEIELRSLSPDEKQRRRVVTNTVMIIFCVLVLLIAFVFLKGR